MAGGSITTQVLGMVDSCRTGARGIFGVCVGKPASRPASCAPEFGRRPKLRRAPDIRAAGIQELSADVSEPVRRAAPRPVSSFCRRAAHAGPAAEMSHDHSSVRRRERRQHAGDVAMKCHEIPIGVPNSVDLRAQRIALGHCGQCPVKRREAMIVRANHAFGYCLMAATSNDWCDAPPLSPAPRPPFRRSAPSRQTKSRDGGAANVGSDRCRRPGVDDKYALATASYLLLRDAEAGILGRTAVRNGEPGPGYSYRPHRASWRAGQTTALARPSPTRPLARQP